MSERKSPKDHASDYKVGDIKKGLDGNKWIIIADKNGVKKWVKYSKPETVKKLFTLPQFYGPHTKKSKTAWYKALPQSIKDQIDVMRGSYKNIGHLGIRVFEYVLHLSEKNIYFIDEPWDFYYEKFAYDDTPVIIPVIKIDHAGTLDLDETISIRCQHANIKDKVKKDFMQFVAEFNSAHNTVQIAWDGKSSHTIDYKFSGILRYT